MSALEDSGEFAGYAEENTAIWNANADWWDDRIGDGNDFQLELIEPSVERLLEVEPGDEILEVACGAGRLARRMAELGATVTAFDASERFIARARKRTPAGSAIEYHVADAADRERLLGFGPGRFRKAVCNMALMDMPEIGVLMDCLRRLLGPGGRFVFSLTHPCFHSAGTQRFSEMFQDEQARHRVRTGIKVSSYRTPIARKTEGILGQPKQQYDFHRPLHVLLGAAFEAGFALVGLEEPGFSAPAGGSSGGLRWNDMPDIPPILVARMIARPS